MKAVDNPVRMLSADCGATGDFRFVGKLSRIRPQAIQSFLQSQKTELTI
jgi:hypothetical protein